MRKDQFDHTKAQDKSTYNELKRHHGELEKTQGRQATAAEDRAQASKDQVVESNRHNVETERMEKLKFRTQIKKDVMKSIATLIVGVAGAATKSTL